MLVDALADPFDRAAADHEQDYLLRAIRQAVKAVIAMSGLRAEGRPEAALEALAEGYAALDVDPIVTQVLGRAALVGLARERGLLEPLGLLLDEEATLREGLGEPELSRRLAAQSLALLVAARDDGLLLSREAQALLST